MMSDDTYIAVVDESKGGLISNKSISVFVCGVRKSYTGHIDKAINNEESDDYLINGYFKLGLIGDFIY